MVLKVYLGDLLEIKLKKEEVDNTKKLEFYSPRLKI